MMANIGGTSDTYWVEEKSGTIARAETIQEE